MLGGRDGYSDTSRHLSPKELLSLYPEHDYSLWDVLRTRCATKPYDTFLVDGERCMSWVEFYGRANSALSALQLIEVGPGDRVGVMSPNCINYVAVYFATMRLGAIFVPLNPSYKLRELSHVISHAGLTVLCCDQDRFSIGYEASQHMAEGPLVVLFDESSPNGLFCDPESFARALKTFDRMGRQPDLPDVVPDQIGLILYTSGTTGSPKGVMHSQRNIVMAGEAFVERMHLQPTDRMLCVLPFFHINALIYSLAGALAAGATLILTKRFSASEFWTLAATTRSTQVNIIAAIGRILIRRPRAEYVPSHCLQKIYGAPIPEDVYRAFKTEFGVRTLVEGYGMTEVPGVLSNPFEGPQQIGTMGLPARHPSLVSPLAEVRIVDAEGADVPDGTTGSLLVKTPIVMKGYYRDEAATKAAFRDGWFLTGDQAYRRPDGFIVFGGRDQDIIRRRGENISASEIDQIVCSHPDVLEAATIAVDSELGEDEVMAVLVLREGSSLSAEEIVVWCAGSLSQSKLPRYIVFAQNLPHTPSHRVAKHLLRQDRSILKERAFDMNRGQSSGLVH